MQTARKAAEFLALFIVILTFNYLLGIAVATIAAALGLQAFTAMLTLAVGIAISTTATFREVSTRAVNFIGGAIYSGIEKVTGLFTRKTAAA